MTSKLVSTKSILAKLLAGEDINVVHKGGISTAGFDLKTRTMYLPIWEDMDGYMYDMLVGHENGHALFTPEEGWHGAIDEHGRGFKSFMNVVEDARIERLIKRKYPGIAKSFTLAYRDLYERDFFGIKKIAGKLDKLNLIDRINIHCKVGMHVAVPFTDEERDILWEVQNTETWKQVVELTKRIFDRVKKEEEDKLNSMEDLTEELMKKFEGMEDGFDDEEMEESGSWDDDFEDDSFDDVEESGDTTAESDTGEESEEEDGESTATSNSDEDAEEDEESEESGKGSGDDSDDDESEEGENEGDTKGGREGGTQESDDYESDSDGNEESDDEDDEEEDPESVTDRMFRSREKELCVGNVEYHNFTLPQPILENIVIPADKVVKHFFIAYDEANHANYPIAKACLKEFNDNNGPFINMMVKEFEMRKNAAQYSRQRQAKTGELDMNKLHLYKFSNDLFKKATIVPKGKSHGLIMYVDMSGSMYDVFGPTIEQALILAVFCKKVGIPFDIYGFSDSNTNIHGMINNGTLPSNFGLANKFKKSGDESYMIKDKGFHLRQFISSDLNNTTFRKAMEMLAVVAYNYKRNSTTGRYALGYFGWGKAGFELGCTPFTQTTLSSRPMIEKFRDNNKLDIVNVIYLTDGYGGNCFTFNGVPSNDLYSSNAKRHKVILSDPKTKQRIEFDGRYGNQQSKMTEFVAEITGCKHIGYYICSQSECRKELRNYMARSDEKEANAAQKSYKLNKFFATPHLGYHKYFFIAMPKTNVEDDDYELDSDWTSRRMATVFKKTQDSKKRNRMLINQFAEEIAT